MKEGAFEYYVCDLLGVSNCMRECEKDVACKIENEVVREESMCTLHHHSVPAGPEHELVCTVIGNKNNNKSRRHDRIVTALARGTIPLNDVVTESVEKSDEPGYRPDMTVLAFEGGDRRNMNCVRKLFDVKVSCLHGVALVRRMFGGVPVTHRLSMIERR